MKLRFLLLTTIVLFSLGAEAKMVITKQTCNYQSGFAIVENGAARVGWQMVSDVCGDQQTARQIEVAENGTGRRVFLGKKELTGESQLVLLPELKENGHGYKWRVRVWDGRKKASEWSAWQLFTIAPQRIEAQWIGAISKREARIPDSRWSNTSFKKQEFKDAWQNVDSLGSKSIWLRKRLQLGKGEVSDAHVMVCGLGHYKLYVNGREVSDAEFAPLWSEYSKTVYYNVYDLTDVLKSCGSEAEISALLGNGMYNVQRNGRYSKFQASYGAPKLLLRMVVNYKDGSQQIVATDESWQWALSPVTFNSIYGGESYDARLENPAEEKWQRAKVVEEPSGRLRPQTAPPVKIMERHGVKSYRVQADGSIVCDMGQNLAGFPEIRVSGGKAGQTVTMLVSEKLNSDGYCDQKQTGRPHFYEYTLGNPSANKGYNSVNQGDLSANSKGTEMSVRPVLGLSMTGTTWHPHFSYYGFRYIQVSGAVMKGEPNPDGLPVIEEISSCFVHNSAEEYSSFESSNPLFTQTHRLIERAERSNMQSVLTDCPHREKLGWLEQDHLNGPSLLYNYDLTTYGPKFIRDITDAQKADGFVPTTAPQYVEFGNQWGDFDDSPEWGSTLVIFPYMYYEQYGDSTLIINNYEAMKSYAAYLKSRSKNGIVSHGLGDWYDYQSDAPAGFSKNTPIPLVGTAHYIYDLQILLKAAKMLNRADDVQFYTTELRNAIDDFNREFYHADSCYYGNNSQCSNALPLYLGIADYIGKDKDRVLGNLLADIKLHGNRLTTGDVGNRYLIQTLSKNGHDELVYKMFNHNETPGYGFQIAQGATTLTEQWDPRNGTSQNHFMMGQIDEWLFRTLAGIRNKLGTYGLRQIVIQPSFPGDLNHVKAKTANLYGTISVEATPTEATVEIPVGCEATVVLPNGTEKHVGSGRHCIK